MPNTEPIKCDRGWLPKSLLTYLETHDNTEGEVEKGGKNEENMQVEIQTKEYYENNFQNLGHYPTLKRPFLPSALIGKGAG